MDSTPIFFRVTDAILTEWAMCVCKFKLFRLILSYIRFISSTAPLGCIITFHGFSITESRYNICTPSDKNAIIDN